VALAIGFSFVLPLSGRALGANNASVLEGSSGVPPGGSPSASVDVRVQVQNTGTTTWRAGSSHRLGANSAGLTNQVAWSAFACGGYVNSVTDARAFLCHDVAPGGTHDFRFRVTMPSSGSARFAVRMVQDGVEWFGETQVWTLTASAPGGPDVVVDSIRIEPASPQAGQAVRFVSAVRNQGTASTPSGVVIGVGYFIDGRWVSYGVVNGPLAPGASVTIGTQGSPWTATAGTHTFEAFADDVNRFPETNESNNKRSMTFSVESGGCPSGGLATPSDRWKLEIFNNRSLSGATVEQRYDVVGTGGFTFDWGSGRASNCTANDDFGIRFSRRFQIATAGEYRFTTRTDDGVRLWVDGALLIDRWIDQAPTSYIATKQLAAGWHDVRMDYYENGGGAYASVEWSRTSGGVGAADLYAINIDPANPKGDPSADDVRNLGARWVRVEYKASHGLSFYDGKIAKHRNAGTKVLLIVDYASVYGKPSGTTGTDAQWTQYLQSFDSGLRTIAQHFRDDVDAWQIWNEPDLPPHPGYDPFMPPKHFGAMLKSSVATIRQFSGRPVVTGGLASGDPNYLAQARDASGGLTVDAVAVHPYGQRAPDNWPNPSWGFGDMSALFDRYLVFGKPLWVTEIGVNTTDQGFQADYLSNVYQLARDRYANRVQVVFWFCWSDGMVPPFGLLDSNLNPKASYHQYRSIAPPR
jgi:hypothetical protein